MRKGEPSERGQQGWGGRAGNGDLVEKMMEMGGAFPASRVKWGTTLINLQFVSLLSSSPSEWVIVEDSISLVVSDKLFKQGN